MIPHRRRPWYVSDRLCDRYRTLQLAGGDIMAIQLFKILEGIVANVVLAGLGWFFVASGGEPTVIGSLTIVVLAVLNGVSLSEYLAARQAIRETDLERSNE